MAECSGDSTGCGVLGGLSDGQPQQPRVFEVVFGPVSGIIFGFGTSLGAEYDRTSVAAIYAFVVAVLFACTTLSWAARFFMAVAVASMCGAVAALDGSAPVFSVSAGRAERRCG